MKLDVLDSWEVQEVRKWRNNELQFLRTPYRITEEMQEAFFDNVINDRDSKHRYFAIMDDLAVIDNVYFNSTTNTFKAGSAAVAAESFIQRRGNESASPAGARCG